MNLTLGNSSITALLLLLDQEGVTPSEKEAASKTIANQVVEITTDSSQARTLFQSEKNLIGERGNSIEGYLLKDNVSVKEVLEAYYRGVTDRNNFRRLSNQYTISEMMLMLGTFMHMMEVRHASLDFAKKSARKLKGIKLIRRIASVESSGDFELLQNLISVTQESNAKMMSYMNSQTDVVMRAILEEMGSNFGFASKKQLEGICLASYDLATLSPVMASYFSERRELNPAVQGDVMVLESCGEHSPKLYETIEFQSKENSKGTK